MLQRRFAKGDRIVHLDKPEWGAGLVTKTQLLSQQGTPVQMVTVRFEHGGLKSLSTAHARLGYEQDYLEQRRDSAPKEPAWPAEPKGTGGAEADPLLAERLLSLPEETRDPFLPLAKRLDATLKLYRFDGTPRSLIDWGIVQSGLQDPLSRFGRHELELLFEKWQRGRDQHLAQLLDKLRQDDPQESARVQAALPSAVRQALQRRHSRR
ncbi:MAG: DUF3553 domain-containing protein [Phycisphaerales bacterium JB038]